LFVWDEAQGARNTEVEIPTG